MLWLYKAVSACPCCSSHWSLMFNLESVNIMNYSESKCSTTQKFVLCKRLLCNVFVAFITYIERNHCLANLHRRNQCCSSCCSRLLRAYESTHGDKQILSQPNGSKHTKPHMTGARHRPVRSSVFHICLGICLQLRFLFLTSKILIPISRVLHRDV